MAGLPIKDRHLYFVNYDKMEFVFDLHEPLNVEREKQYQIVVKECLIPRVKVLVPAGYIVWKEGHKRRIPNLYVSTLGDLVTRLNKELDKHVFTYSNEGRVGVMLSIGDSFRVSPHYGKLLFEDKTFLRSGANYYEFKSRRDYEENTYYLTCDLVNETVVNSCKMAVVDTLVLRYRKGRAQAHLTWEQSQGEVYLKSGTYNKIKLSVRDEFGELVKSKGGISFLHIKVCT